MVPAAETDAPLHHEVRLPGNAPLRIELPRLLVLRLHAHKLTTGRTIAKTVEEALLDFFDRVDAESRAARAPGETPVAVATIRE